MSVARHLAQFNIGRLRAEPGDPRVAEFMNAIETVNNIGRRSSGFVWMMEGAGEPRRGNTDVKIDGDARFIANLTVWESVEALENFVWNTVHRQFYARRSEWFTVLGKQHFVLWWVPAGHRPTIDEALARLAHLDAEGDRDHAFGWSYLKEAQLWHNARCAPVAAE